MPSARALKAGKGVIELSLLSGAVEKGLKSLQKKADAIGGGFKKVGKIGLAAGTAITSGFLGAASIFANVGDSLDEMAGRTSVSVETLSELGFAAEQSGASLETVEKAILFMRKNNLDPKKWDEYAAAVMSIEDPTKRTQKAMELFGKKTGPMLLPMLADLKALRQESRDLALVMSTEDAKAGGLLADTFGTIMRQVRRVAEVVGAAVAGPLTEFLMISKGLLAKLTVWLDSNRQLVKTIFFVGLALSVAGGILFSIGTAFTLAGVAAGGFVTVASAIAAVLGAVLSPVGLLIVGLGGLVAWFATSTTAGRNMASGFVDWFNQIKTVFGDTFGGITDALSSGDLKTAGEVALAGLNLAWQVGIQPLKEIWIKFFNWLMETMTLTALEIGRQATLIWNAVQSGPEAWNATIGNLMASIGEQVGHQLTQSTDSALAAEQEKAHERAKQFLGEEARQQMASIEAAERAINKRFDDAEAQVPVADEQSKKDLAASKKKLEDAYEALRVVRETAAERAAQAKATLTDTAQNKLAPAVATAKSADVQRATNQTAVFDARMAAQMFGSRSVDHKQLQALEDIRSILKINRAFGLTAI